MVKKKRNTLNSFFDKFAHRITLFAGSTTAFSIAFSIIVVWILSGPVFGFSDTWQLVINTSTTIITFLMVFLIQRSQNKDSLAVQLKLNELVAVTKGASNRLIDVEDLTEEEMQALETYFRRIAQKTKLESDLTKSHSIEEAEKLAKKKSI